MDVVIFTITTAVAIITSLYLFGISQVSFLKKNWVEYRCNPLYMPLAGMVGDSIVTNFTKCTIKGFQDYSGYVMDPIMGEFAIVNETVTEIGSAMSSMRTMMTGVRGGFLGIIGSVFGKIQNLISQFQYIIIRMRTLLSRVVGVMLSFLYVFYAGMETGESVMNGPIGETVSFLCFDPNTMVVLNTKFGIPMKSIKVGDTLHTGETVTAVYKMSGKDVTMYQLDGVTVSGEHKVNFNGNFIPVKKHPKAHKLSYDLPYLVCLDTNTHRIHLQNTEFLDFVEKDRPFTGQYHDASRNVVLIDETTIPIAHVPIGSMLRNGNHVIGTIQSVKGRQLITEKGVFSIIRDDGHMELVSDGLFAIKLSQ